MAKYLCRQLLAALANLLVWIAKRVGLARLKRYLLKPSVARIISRLTRLALAKKNRYQEQNLQQILSLPAATIKPLSQQVDQAMLVTLLESLTMDGHYYAQTRWQGLEHIKPAPGQGLLFVSAHINNWEICRQNLWQLGYPCQYLYRDFSHTWFDHRAVNRRARHGKGGIATSRTAEFIGHLQQGGVGFMLIDLKDKGRNGVKLDFCGYPAWTSSLPAQLAQQHGVQVVPVVLRRTATGYEQQLHPAVDASQDPASMMRYINSCLASEIMARPETWALWNTNRWGV